MKNGWHILTVLTFIAFTLMACGGEDDALEGKIDALQNDIDLLKAHVGIKTEEPPPDEVGKPPIGTLLPPARDDGRHGVGDRAPTDNVEPPKADVPQLGLPPAPPQKGRIIFESRGDIFAVDSDGGNLTNLTNHIAYDSRPTCSPDGKQIAFVSDRDRIPKIFVMDANGENQRLYIEMGDSRLDTPEWAPHGGLIVFTEQSDKMHIGGNIKPVFLGEGHQPTWSVLGQIAYVAKPPIERNGPPRIDGIYVINAHGGRAVRLMLPEEYGTYPAFSPDGRLIAYVGSRDDIELNIYVMNDDGSNKINLSLHPGEDRAPTWSPDGRQIAFMSNRDDTFNWEIYVMNADGSSQRNITNNATAHDMFPSWGP